MMTKAECRTLMKQLVQEHAECLSRLSQKALTALQRNAHFEAARTVLLFHSLNDEVDTHAFLCEVARRKRVFLPVVRGEAMFMAEFLPDEPACRGRFGIEEPQTPLYHGAIDVAVVPGMAFSAAGHRLGRGRGYYDRFLAQCACYKIGLCFSFQCLDAIPAEPHDIMMDEVITD